MKQTQEFDGKNVEAAVEKACLALNVSKKNLVYDVISSGSTGIFGIVGVKKARIRVTLPEKKGGDTHGSTSQEERDRAGIMSIVDEAFGKETKNKPSQKSPEIQTEVHHVENGEHQTKIEEAQPKDTAPADAERTQHTDRRRSHNGKKHPSGDNSNGSRPRRSRSNGHKQGNARNTPEKDNNHNKAVSEEHPPPGEEHPAPEKQGRRRSQKNRPASENGERKPSGAKPYGRKSRSRKKDTWLREDGDAVLNEAMASSDNLESVTENGTQTVNPETSDSVKEQDKKTGVEEKISVAVESSSNQITDSLQADGIIVDSFSGDELADNGEPEEEMFDDGYESERFSFGDIEEADDDDKNYAYSDDDIVETYDERDDGYPPRYKGEIPVDVSEEAMRVGQETLQKMVTLITDDATVTASRDEDRLLLRVEGGNSGVLIGRRGQTLEAMQFLTDKIINRFSESRVRLKVDIEGYMETRKANLRTLAYKMADKAKKTGKPATINQMTAQDRRIVHLALKDDTRVRTQSMGEGYYRRLVIFPKKSSFKRRKPFKKQN